MPVSRAVARSQRLAGVEVECASDKVRLLVDAWFENGCRSRREACRIAGYTMSQAGYVFQRQDVIIEIERRRNLLRRETEITEARVIAELGKIAFASLGDLLEIQEDGSAWIDMTAITEDQKAALSEYHVETYDEARGQGAEMDEEGGLRSAQHIVKKSKIKFHDKKAALDSLARIMGMNNDKLAVTVGLTLSDKVQQARQRLQPTIEGEIVK